MKNEDIRYTPPELYWKEALEKTMEDARFRAAQHSKSLKRLKDKARIRTIREDAKEGGT